MKAVKRLFAVVCAASLFSLSGCGASKEQVEVLAPNVVVGESKAEGAGGSEDRADAGPGEQARNAPIPPDEYVISAELDWEGKTISGVERLTFHNRSDIKLDILEFNVYLNAFRDPDKAPVFEELYGKVYESGGGADAEGYLNITSAGVGVHDAPFQQEGAVLRVVLPETVNPGGTLDISLKFEAKIPRVNHRIGYNDYAAWFGDFFPVACPLYEDGLYVNEYVKAGFPFTHLPANWTVSVTADKGLTVCGSGEESVINAGGKFVTTMTAKLARDFAFAAGPSYEVDTVKTAGGVYINFYHYSLFNVEEASAAAAEVFARTNSYLGNYPYLSYDAIECGLHIDGAEGYAGLSLIDSGVLRGGLAPLAVAGEVNRQFFGEIVGGDRTEYAWLFDGLPAYLGSVARAKDDAELILEAANIPLTFPQEGARLADALDAYKDWGSYMAAQNKKAWLMCHNLRNIMGVEKFREFLREFYKQYSFKQATGDDFRRIAEEVHGSSLKGFFDEWIDGKS